MSKPSHNSPGATHLDVERLLGPLDSDTVMAVMKLSPTLEDIETAAVHMAGGSEALPERHQPTGTVMAIIELVARNDEDEGLVR